MHADEAGLSLPCLPDQVVDIYFGEQRVMSLAPDRFTMRAGRARAPWPETLKRRLDGRTTLVVREHLTGEVLLDEPVQFGSSTETISITDREGRPLAVDKFGGLVRMFAQTERATAEHLAQEAARLARDVADFGVPAYLAFGSLLGAVRNGQIIGHDTDIDLAYLSRFRHPADIALESFAMERFLQARGWKIDRIRTGLLHVMVRDQDGDIRHIDIFLSVHDGTHLFVSGFIHAELEESALLPLSEVTLEGVDFPAPADPGAWLSVPYGPSYLVPDPSFTYRLPRSLSRTSLAWMGNYRVQLGGWERRYRPVATKPLPAPSEFGKEVGELAPEGATIVDVGCGRAGDAIRLARAGRRVVGIDYARPALRRARAVAQREDLDATFERVSLYDLRRTLAVGAWLAAEPGELVVMSRNLLDVLTREGRANFWLLCRTALLHGGTLHVRFRREDPGGDDPDPGFAPLDPDVVQAEAVARGARVLRREDRGPGTVMSFSWA
jgi:SAM-dependent methyltransferase